MEELLQVIARVLYPVAGTHQKITGDDYDGDDDVRTVCEL